MEIKQIENVVIGGGISGLTKAFALKQAQKEFVLLEAKEVVGGNISSEKVNGFSIEKGPNSFALNEHSLQLIKTLGLENELQYATADAGNRYIFLKNELVKVGFKNLFFTGKLLSLKSRWKLITEFSRKKENIANESISAFVSRRLSKEFLDHLINGIVGGIFAGNPDELCLQSVFPKMYAMEQDFGSLTKAAIRKKSQGKRQLVSFKNGLQTLPNALYAQCKENVKTQAKVEKIEAYNGAYLLHYIQNGEKNVVECKHIYFTNSAHSTASILQDYNAKIAHKIAAIPYAPLISVNIAFAKKQVKKDIKAFGFLVPKIENAPLLGCIFNSTIFEGKADKEYHLFTLMIGGMLNADVLKNTEQSIANAVNKLKEILAIEGDAHFQRENIYQQSIPQYNIGHQDFLKSITQFEQENKGLHFSANWLKGVAISDCIAHNFF